MDQFTTANINCDCLWNPSFNEKSAYYTRVIVVFENGPPVVEEAAQPSTHGRPFSNEGIRNEWTMLANSIMVTERRDNIETLICELEGVGDIDEIMQLLVAKVLSPIEINQV